MSVNGKFVKKEFVVYDFNKISAFSENFSLSSFLSPFLTAKKTLAVKGDKFASFFGNSQVVVKENGQVFIDDSDTPIFKFSSTSDNFAFTCVKFFSENQGFYLSDGNLAFIYNGDDSIAITTSVVGTSAIFLTGKLFVFNKNDIFVLDVSRLDNIDKSYYAEIYSPEFTGSYILTSFISDDKIYAVYKDCVAEISYNGEGLLSIIKKEFDICVKPNTACSFNGVCKFISGEYLYKVKKGQASIVRLSPTVLSLLTNSYEFLKVCCNEEYYFVFDNSSQKNYVINENGDIEFTLSNDYFLLFKEVLIPFNIEPKFLFKSRPLNFNNYKTKNLDLIKCNTTLPAILTVSNGKFSKKYMLNSGENNVKVSIKGNDFCIEFYSEYSAVISELKFIYKEN